MLARTVGGMLMGCCTVVTASACAALGYSDRVLWRLPSPDGQLVAVCQEVPALDGPDYDVRLETSDGNLLRQLYVSGDGDPCSEMAWSSDGRTLAVLSSHAARVRFVDVAWAVAHPEVRTAYWSWRQVDLSTEYTDLQAAGLLFVGPMTVQLGVCAPQPGGSRAKCESGFRQFDIPQPIVTGH